MYFSTFTVFITFAANQINKMCEMSLNIQRNSIFVKISVIIDNTSYLQKHGVGHVIKARSNNKNRCSKEARCFALLSCFRTRRMPKFLIL